MRHDADLVTGPEYDYLGHFKNPKWLALGHNDVDQSGKINNADDQNSYVQGTESGVAPGATASQVGQFASFSGAGQPL